MADFNVRRRAYVNRPATPDGQPCGYTWQGTTCTAVGAHFCEQRDARVAWFMAELTPLQQDAYVERLFDDDRRTDPPVVKEADVVALLEAHLRGDEAAINNLIDATNEGDLFEATVGFLVAAFGEEEVAGVLGEWHRRHRSH
jgi:hypothetical protein